MEHHHLFSNKFRELEKRELYLALSLRALGISVVGVFIPIYLYKLGYGLRGVIIFSLLHQLMRLVIGPLGSLLVARRGPNHLLAAALASVIVQTILFNTLPSSHWPLWLLAAITATTDGWYMLGYSMVFSKIRNPLHTGVQTANINELLSLGTAFGPLIGGLIGSHFGIQYSFAFSFVILLAAAVPLLVNRELPSQHEFSLNRLKQVANPRDLLAAFGKGTDNMAATVLWPLAIFFIVGSYAGVGAIASIGLIIALVTIRIVGRLSDSRQQLNVFRLGYTSAAFLHLGRILAFSTTAALIVNTLDDVLNWTLLIPWQSSVFRNADQGGRLEYLTAMEFAVTTGRLAYWVVLLGLSWVLRDRQLIVAGFIGSALGVMLVSLIRRPAQA